MRILGKRWWILAMAVFVAVLAVYFYSPSEAWAAPSSAPPTGPAGGGNCSGGESASAPCGDGADCSAHDGTARRSRDPQSGPPAGVQADPQVADQRPQIRVHHLELDVQVEGREGEAWSRADRAGAGGRQHRPVEGDVREIEFLSKIENMCKVGWLVG